MAVSREGKLIGTIGGGPMEFSLVGRARESLQRNIAVRELIPQVHRRDAEGKSSGMICQGEQLVVLCTLDAKERAKVGEIVRGYREQREGSWMLSAGKGLQWSEGSCEGGRSFGAAPQDDGGGGEQWCYRENFQFHHRLYIIGGGHVGLALSRIAATLEFFITVIDHRREVATLKENTFAHQLLVEPYQELTRLIPEGLNIFVVVVSTNAKTDELALRHLQGKELGYLGVMGSEGKLAHLRSVLPEKGLERLRGPIGVPIASHTAEEIAVSIAAELIKVKNSSSVSYSAL
jgi:xanthine dehydrogenase accessory factor